MLGVGMTGLGGLLPAYGPLVIGAASVVVGVGAWRTGAAVAALERGRQHIALTPVVEASCRELTEHRLVLAVTLIGPAALGWLDGLELRIRPDRYDREPGVAGGPTAEQIAAQVWGPARFTPGVDGAHADGRTVPPRRIHLLETRQFALERTSPPTWADADSWRQEFGGQPLRLALVATRDGYPAWTLAIDVKIKPQM